VVCEDGFMEGDGLMERWIEFQIMRATKAWSCHGMDVIIMWICRYHKPLPANHILIQRAVKLPRKSNSSLCKPLDLRLSPLLSYTHHYAHLLPR
jgi:hypothetical protein